MRKKTYCFNPILLNDLKRFWILSAFYSFILFLLVPLKLLNLISEHVNIGELINSNNFIFTYEGFMGLQPLIIFLIAIFIAVALFYEIQNCKSNDHIHSLPISKKDIFINKVLAGEILIFIPCFINYIITEIIVLQGTIPVHHYKIINYFIMTFINTNILFLQGVFFAVVTTNVFLHVFVSFAINLVPFFIVEMGNDLLNIILPERLSESISLYNLKYILPLSYMIEGRGVDTITIKNIILYILSMALLFLLSYILFIKRKNEDINKTITFNFLNDVFKYTTTFISMIIFSLILSGYFKIGVTFTVINCIIGSFLGYYISEMIIRKELYVFNRLKGYFIYLGIAVVFLILLLNTDLIYKHTPPRAEEVKEVYISTQYNEDKINSSYLIKDKNTIKNIISLQKYLIGFKNNRGWENQVYIVYKLNNGDMIKRYYRGNFGNEFITQMEEISKNIQYKKLNYDILNIDFSDIECIDLNYGKDVYEVTDKEKIRKIYDIVCDGFMNNKFNNLGNNYNTFVNFKIKNDALKKYNKKYGDIRIYVNINLDEDTINNLIKK
ncbi:MAG: hypothetical protein N2448_07315 [Caloramator sp.]|nr:hypothetical protein [Caloramator sp.]